MKEGLSREEAEAEAAWDPTEADPESEERSFDEIYSINDEVPDDVREELMQPGYGPPVCHRYEASHHFDNAVDHCVAL
jgi:hypothetical protein